MSENHLSDLAFSALALPDALRKGIVDAGFEYCTPIQQRTLPIALEGRDVAGQAQTGTGKTAAFLIALFTRLLGGERPESERSAPRALILAPTRELAAQVHQNATEYGSLLPHRSAVVFGGVKINLDGGSPGRTVG